MYSRNQFFWLATTFLFFWGSSSQLLMAQENADQTLSPYFLVISEENSLDIMPLKITETTVDIVGTIAHVKMEQTYQNEGSQVLEAIYVFPGSSKAAIHQMRLKIGQREIVAEIAERAAAQQAYEQAKEEGYTASLLNQERPNVFQMNVANILPGDEVTVTLEYSEMLVPDKGTYEFVYPTLVAPRYFNTETLQAAIGGKDAWILNPYLQDGVKPNYRFDIRTRINAGMPLAEVSCPSHKVDIAFSEDAGVADIRLKGDDFGGNRDYVIQYQLSAQEISSGLLLYEEEDEQFFLATIQPPKAVTPEQLPAREYVFIVDVSGSMHGLPLHIVQDMLTEITASFRPEDAFNLMLFSSSNVKLAEQPIPATQENIATALSLLNNYGASGDTELLPALKSAFAQPARPGYSRSFVVITDGYITIEQEVFEMIRQGLNQANLFAIGIGQDVNRFLIEGMAYAGMGEPLIITERSQAQEKAMQFVQYINRPVLTDISLSIEGLEAYDIIPQAIPDLMAERPITIMGKYKGTPNGVLKVNGKLGNQSSFSKSMAFSQAKPEPGNEALKYLWARQKVKELDDYQQANQSETSKKAVTDLGLKYRLLTQYTSFVAIDTEARAQEANTTVRQALPMPAGLQRSNNTYTMARPSTDASRSLAGAGKLNAVLPKSTPAIEGLARIDWHLTWSSPLVEDEVTFEFVAKDLYGKELLRQEVESTSLTLDLREEPFLSAKGLIMYEIQVKGRSDIKSDSQVLKKTKLSATKLTLLKQLQEDGSAEGLLKLATFYEDLKMHAHALAVFDLLLAQNETPQNRYIYQAFLSRNSLSE